MPCTGRKWTMDELNEKFFMQIAEQFVWPCVYSGLGYPCVYFSLRIRRVTLLILTYFYFLIVLKIVILFLQVTFVFRLLLFFYINIAYI